MFPAITYLNGISAALTCFLGFFFSIRFILLYYSEKKTLMPLISLLGFTLGCFYLGPTVSLFTLIFTNGTANISGALYSFLSYLATPVAVSTAMYLGYNIFEPKWKNKVLTIYLFTAVIFWVALIGWNDQMITTVDPGDGELRDISFTSIVLILIAFYIFSALFILGGNFFILAQKIKGDDKVHYKKAMFLSFGWVFFTIAGVLDTFITGPLIVFARFCMIIAYILIFEGFMPIKEKKTEE